jgi:hypothetical protein
VVGQMIFDASGKLVYCSVMKTSIHGAEETSG